MRAMQAKAPADAVGWRVDVCENGRREWRTGLVVAVVTNGRGGSGGGDNTRDRISLLFPPLNSVKNNFYIDGS